MPEAVRLSCGPCSGVALPPQNAIEWVADPQEVCHCPPLLRLSWSGTHALPWQGALQLCAFVGRRTFLTCSVWWVEDIQML